MAKFNTYVQYPSEGTGLAEQALLTVWGSLSRFHEELVLVGGLAVKLVTRPPQGSLPGPVTMDVDLGIHMGVDSRLYSSLRESLQSQGFDWQGQRFVRQVNRLELFVDLLTDGETEMSSVIVDDSLPVAVIPGISRALDKAEYIHLEGLNLLGAACSESIRVAGPGPLLVLKLNAFGGPTGRRAGKDAHDILYLVQNHRAGVIKVVQAFREEKACNNRGIAGARSALESYFLTEDAEGPMACAAFRLNNLHMSPEHREEALRIRQQCVTLAEELLAII